MDHLPEPHRPLGGTKLLVPCRCSPNDVDKGWLGTYPLRKGYHAHYWEDNRFTNIIRLPTPNWSRPSVEQSTILLQQWLFFGLLNAYHCVYGTEFDGNKYIHSVNGAGYLTLQQLPQDADIWFRTNVDKPEAVRRKQLYEAEGHLTRALLFFIDNFTEGSSGAHDHIVREHERLVIESNFEIMLATLLEALCIVPQSVRFCEWKGNRGLDANEVCHATRRLMNSSTWCPSELQIMDDYFDNGSYCFARRLVRSGSEVCHSVCTRYKCLAYQLKESSYRTAHTTACKGCREMAIEPADLTAILESADENTNPRVRITISDRDEVAISAVTEGSYVAISHVWSDGMGHPPGVNSLPECQIRRLSFLVKQTGLEEAIVWIDSLCVPANPGHFKRKALAQMANIYRGAKNVLVLDSDLLSIPSSCCNEELLLRIALSRWMRRLWTFEEGVVARPRLLFQLSDQSICLPEPKKSFTDSIAEKCTSMISRYLPAKVSVRSVITALHFRSTSWIADEPICISYILDLRTSSILSIDWLRQDLRMLELYRQITRKNPVLTWRFFFTKGEKLNISPFRWAPMSLLNLDAGDANFLRGDWDATQTERGLQFRGRRVAGGPRPAGVDLPHSFLLSFGEGANIKKCMIIRIDDEPYVLCPVPKKQERQSTSFWKGIGKQMSLDADPSRDWTENWQEYYGFRPTGNWGMIQNGLHGAMVAINEARDGVLYATYIGKVHIFRLEKMSSIPYRVRMTEEFWGQVGSPTQNENHLRQMLELVEGEIFDEEHYSLVTCVQEVGDDLTWCIQ